MEFYTLDFNWIKIVLIVFCIKGFENSLFFSRILTFKYVSFTFILSKTYATFFCFVCFILAFREIFSWNRLFEILAKILLVMKPIFSQFLFKIENEIESKTECVQTLKFTSSTYIINDFWHFRVYEMKPDVKKFPYFL